MRTSIISFGPVESKSNGYFIRTWQIAKFLKELGHEVLVLEFTDKKTSPSAAQYDGIIFFHLSGNEAKSNSVGATVSKILSFDVFRIVRLQLHSLIELFRLRDCLEHSDLVFVEGGLFALGLITCRLLRKTLLLDTHCINKPLAADFKDRQTLAYYARRILWDILERFETRLSDAVIVVSEKEKRIAQKEYKIPEEKIFIIPNVLEFRKHEYLPQKLTDLKRSLELEYKTIVTFIGDLESIQNKDAMSYIICELAPLLWREERDVAILIVGKGSEGINQRLPNVRFAGFVQDLEPYLAISDICIAPLRVGSGVKTKILTYMACEKPIVTTPIGIEGLRIETDSVLVADIPQFPKTLLSAIENLGELTVRARKDHSTVVSWNSVSLAKQELKRALECLSKAE